MNKKLICLILTVLISIAILPVVFAQFENVLGTATNMIGGIGKTISGVGNIFKNLSNKNFLYSFGFLTFALFLLLNKAPFFKDMTEGKFGSKFTIILSVIVAYSLTNDWVIKQGQTFAQVMTSVWSLCFIGFGLYTTYKYQEGEGFKYIMPIGSLFGIISALISPYYSIFATGADVSGALTFNILLWGAGVPFLVQILLNKYDHELNKKYGEDNYKKLKKLLKEKEEELKKLKEEAKNKVNEADKMKKDLQSQENKLKDGQAEIEKAKKIAEKNPNNVQEIYPHIAKAHDALPKEYIRPISYAAIPVSAAKIQDELKKGLQERKELLRKIKEDFAATKAGKQAAIILMLIKKLKGDEGKKWWAHYTGENWNDADRFEKLLIEEAKDAEAAKIIADELRSMIEERKDAMLQSISKEEFEKRLNGKLREVIKLRIQMKKDLENVVKIEEKSESGLIDHYKKVEEIYEIINDRLNYLNDKIDEINSNIKKTYYSLRRIVDLSITPEERLNLLRTISIDTLMLPIGTQIKTLQDLKKYNKKLYKQIKKLTRARKVFDLKTREGFFAREEMLSYGKIKREVV